MLGQVTLQDGDVVECIAYDGVPGKYYTVGKLYNVTDNRGVATVKNNGGTRSYEEFATFKLIRRVDEDHLRQAKVNPTIPTDIREAYLDGYEAATNTAKSVVLRIAPELDSSIALGISAVGNILQTQLIRFQEDDGK